MRNGSFATLGVLALLAAGSAVGQTKLRVDIPFEFHFANTVMPAGQYSVDADGRGIRDLLSIDCAACRAQALAPTYGIGTSTTAPTEGRLVFNKYGDTYFLSEVWVPGRVQGGALSKSKTERELARTTPDVARITLPARTSPVTSAHR